MTSAAVVLTAALRVRPINMAEIYNASMERPLPPRSRTEIKRLLAVDPYNAHQMGDPLTGKEFFECDNW